MPYDYLDEPPQDAPPFDYGQPAPQASPYPFGIPPNGGNPAGYMDLSYWISRGVDPSEIFDTNTGQLKPGWARTGNGYERQGAAPATPVPPESIPFTYGGGGGETRSIGTGQFDYGRPLTNQFTAYQPFNFTPFSFGEFKPSTRDDLFNEQLNPGFKRSQERLQKQIEGGAAYRGMLRSVMTFDQLGSILSNNEESQFKAFDDRNFRNWDANRRAAFDAFNTNTNFGMAENERSNNFRFNTEKATADDLLSRWQTLVNSTMQLTTPR